MKAVMACYNFDNMNVRKIKKILLYTTVGLFAASALIGIVVVLSASFNMIVGRIISTTTLLGALALFSMNNIMRTEDERIHVKVLSIIALISNLVWSLPWLLIIWDVLKVDTGNALVLSRIISTAAIVSFNTTLSASFLSFKKYTALIIGLAIMTIASSAIIGIYFLICLYCRDYKIIGQLFEDTWRVVVISGILLVFGVITTPILARSAAKKDNESSPETAPITPAATEAELRAQIEEEVRAEVEAEMHEKLAAEQSSQEQAPAESTNEAPEHNQDA